MTDRPDDGTDGDTTEEGRPPAESPQATSESPPPVAGPVRSAAHTRRRVLGHLAAGSAAALAGCGLFDGDSNTNPNGTTATPTDAGPTRLDRTLYIPTENDPRETTFYGHHSVSQYLRQAFAMRVLESASLNLQRIVWEAGLWPDGLFVGAGDVHYTWLEDPIEITPKEVKVTVGEDAAWSDGHPVTGADVACLEIQQMLRNAYPPYYAEEGEDPPGNVWAAVDDFEITDRSVTYTSSAGHFANFWDIHIRNQLGTFLGPHHVPTHIEPYASYAEAVFEAARRAQAGEINPWKGHRDPRARPDAPTKRSLIDEHLNDVQWVEKFAKPENVLSTGAWNVVDMSGSEFVFEPNEHHRNADRINFETLVATFTSSDRRRNAAIRADRLDFASSAFGSPVPQQVVDSFPDTIRELLVPGNQYTGTEMALNFDHSGLENRAVRAAIMYAIDHEAVAGNIHATAAPPITTPGGDCWDATDYVSREWIDEHLTTYDTDRKRAARLMRKAGYERRDGRWIDADGNQLTIDITTTDDAPRWEPTVASQLTGFGIDSTVRTLEGGTFSQRVDAGQLSAWPSNINSLTNMAPYTLFIWLSAAANHRTFGIFPDEQFESGAFFRGTPIPQTEDRYRDFSIRAPPIGEPDGELTEYHPAAASLFFQSNPPEAEFRRRVETGIWLANWFLPTIPIARQREQFFIDDANWEWPTETPWWQSFESGSALLSGSLFGQGTTRAKVPSSTGGTATGDGS